MTNALDQQFVLMQLADSFFPSGSYTLSHGLESLVQSGRVTSAEDVETFIRLLLCNKVGRTDLVAIAHDTASKHNNITELTDIDAQLFAQTPVEKTRLAQRQSGRALLMVASKTWPHHQLESLSKETAKGTFNCLTSSIVFSVVAQVAGLEQQSALVAFVHGFVTGILGAAIRLGAIGSLQAQQVRRAVAKDMADVVERRSPYSSLI